MHVIGTAGHVDHGKSTLVEALTGIDPDRFAEEKRRGLTIDLGFAWLALPSGEEVGLVDVPGHERFIKNMLAGAGGISICLFVVAANEGWKPQSAEHLAIVDLLGVSAGVVALTKADLVDEDELSLVLADVQARLAPSSLRTAAVVPCSPVSGFGMDALVTALDEVVIAAPPAPDIGRPRLWVDRVFTIAGAGTVVTGTLAGGGFTTGQEVEISPEGRRARIRAIQTHKKEVAEIGPGNRAALNLGGLERRGAGRGDAVVEPHRWRPTRRIDAELRVVSQNISGAGQSVTEKGSHLLYMGSAETPARVRLLDVDELPAGASGFAEIELRDALPVARGDRFVLRDAGRVLTLGGGRVLDPMPHPARRSDGSRVALLEKLRDASADVAFAALVEAEGAMSVRDAVARSGAPEAPAGVTVLGDLAVSSAHLEELSMALHAALADHHAVHPLESGMPREAARARVGLEPGPFEALARALADVVEQGAVIKLATHSVTLDAGQEIAREELLARIEGGGFTPPLASELHVDADLLRALTKAGDMVKIGDFYLTAAQAKDARERVRSEIEQKGPLTVAQIRDLLATSRKYAVPLCEWLDATGATRRRGDVRELGPNE